LLKVDVGGGGASKAHPVSELSHQVASYGSGKFSVFQNLFHTY